MKLFGTKADLIARWRKKIDDKTALGEAYPLTESGKRKCQALIALAEARAYETCANELELLKERKEPK